MTHYPGHLRAAFTDWIDDGQPDSALVEVDHEPTELARADDARAHVPLHGRDAR